VDVAVRKLREEGADAHNQVMQEAELMTRLRSPYLAQLYGISVDDTLYLVMEFVPLGPLSDYLRNASVRANMTDIVQLVSCVCEGKNGVFW
jgi:serine/threonine protein kinase